MISSPALLPGRSFGIQPKKPMPHVDMCLVGLFYSAESPRTRDETVFSIHPATRISGMMRMMSMRRERLNEEALSHRAPV
ncbi:hypothetical protein QQF64_033168 [Cirrhinus molitorella]|uniref:Uncharacterized protein n=1 Tax=Cirrhinus molitorella TaxID=172907 RepID=A0ABR3MTB8_9TELE